MKRSILITILLVILLIFLTGCAKPTWTFIENNNYNVIWREVPKFRFYFFSIILISIGICTSIMLWNERKKRKKRKESMTLPYLIIGCCFIIFLQMLNINVFSSEKIMIDDQKVVRTYYKFPTPYLKDHDTIWLNNVIKFDTIDYAGGQDYAYYSKYDYSRSHPGKTFEEGEKRGYFCITDKAKNTIEFPYKFESYSTEGGLQALLDFVFYIFIDRGNFEAKMGEKNLLEQKIRKCIPKTDK